MLADVVSSSIDLPNYQHSVFLGGFPSWLTFHSITLTMWGVPAWSQWAALEFLQRLQARKLTEPPVRLKSTALISGEDIARSTLGNDAKLSRSSSYSLSERATLMLHLGVGLKAIICRGSHWRGVPRGGNDSLWYGTEGGCQLSSPTPSYTYKDGW